MLPGDDVSASAHHRRSTTEKCSWRRLWNSIGSLAFHKYWTLRRDAQMPRWRSPEDIFVVYHHGNKGHANARNYPKRQPPQWRSVTTMTTTSGRRWYFRFRSRDHLRCPLAEEKCWLPKAGRGGYTLLRHKTIAGTWATEITNVEHRAAILVLLTPCSSCDVTFRWWPLWWFRERHDMLLTRRAKLTEIAANHLLASYISRTLILACCTSNATFESDVIGDSWLAEWVQYTKRRWAGHSRRLVTQHDMRACA